MDAWLAASAQGLSARDLARLFETALGALWARTETTLGEVTLSAIGGRVFHNAAEKFPFFASLERAPSRGIHPGFLPESIASESESDLREGIRFVLVHFLTVLGNLTAEILTPELHAELSDVVLPEASARDPGRHASQSNQNAPVEDSRS